MEHTSPTSPPHTRIALRAARGIRSDCSWRDVVSYRTIYTTRIGPYRSTIVYSTYLNVFRAHFNQKMNRKLVCPVLGHGRRGRSYYSIAVLQRRARDANVPDRAVRVDRAPLPKVGRRLKECRLLCLRCKTRCFARRHAARSDSVEERAVPLTFEPHMGVGVRHSTHSSPSVAAQIEATVTFSTTSP